MKIVAFGDSWVWGDELSDDLIERQKINITGKIRNHYKIETLNYSVNGASLDEILFQLMIYINSENYDKNDIVLIGLTSPSRWFHYNNIIKDTFRSPFWDYESFKNWGPKKLTSLDEYETWWKSHVKFNVNTRNDIINYVKSLLSMKTILQEYIDKYIVWQSIDGNLYDYIEGGYQPLAFPYYTKDKQLFNDECKIFSKEYFNNILNKNTSDTQLWLNISEPSWEDWLKINHSDKDVFFEYNFHPTEYGIHLWFDNFLKKYINKILDN